MNEIFIVTLFVGIVLVVGLSIGNQVGYGSGYSRGYDDATFGKNPLHKSTFYNEFIRYIGKTPADAIKEGERKL
jgi:hypothetical protein